MSDLLDIGDASVLEKWYHRTCLRSAHRTTYAADYNDTQLIRSICDEELIISIPNTVTGDDITLSMAEVNEEYVSTSEMTPSIPYRVSELEKNI